MIYDIYVYIYIHLYIIYTFTHTYIIYLYLCSNMYISHYISIYMYMCIYIYIGIPNFRSKPMEFNASDRPQDHRRDSRPGTFRKDLFNEKMMAMVYCDHEYDECLIYLRYLHFWNSSFRNYLSYLHFASIKSTKRQTWTSFLDIAITWKVIS